MSKAGKIIGVLGLGIVVTVLITLVLNRFSGPAPDQILKNPITIAASGEGIFDKGYPWFLVVESTGQAKLKIAAPTADEIREFSVSELQLSQLRESLIEKDFFGLRSSYGDAIPGGSTQSIIISVGDSTKSVRIGSLDPRNRGILDGVKRARAVHQIIRSWITDPLAGN